MKINSHTEKVNAKEDFNESDDEPLIIRKERKKRTRKESEYIKTLFCTFRPKFETLPELC